MSPLERPPEIATSEPGETRPPAMGKDGRGSSRKFGREPARAQRVLPDSKGESLEGVDWGDALRAELTAKEAAELAELPPEIPLELEPEVRLPFADEIFLATFSLEERLSFSPAEGGGCCFACCLHFALLFLNQT